MIKLLIHNLCIMHPGMDREWFQNGYPLSFHSCSKLYPLLDIKLCPDGYSHSDPHLKIESSIFFSYEAPVLALPRKHYIDA